MSVMVFLQMGQASFLWTSISPQSTHVHRWWHGESTQARLSSMQITHSRSRADSFTAAMDKTILTSLTIVNFYSDLTCGVVLRRGKVAGVREVGKDAPGPPAEAPVQLGQVLPDLPPLEALFLVEDDGLRAGSEEARLAHVGEEVQHLNTKVTM